MSNPKPIVLIVDDDVMISQAIARALRNETFEVRACSSAQEALEIFKHSPIALVITDFQMPGTSGLGLIRDLLKIRPDFKRMILSGFSDPGMIQSALESGEIHRYLKKPIDATQLKEAIYTLIE